MQCSQRGIDLRNTSTYVEQIPLSDAETTRRKKHLHVRGADFKATADAARTEETPPRTWSRSFFLCCQAPISGNTSTYVEQIRGRLP